MSFEILAYVAVSRCFGAYPENSLQIGYLYKVTYLFSCQPNFIVYGTFSNIAHTLLPSFIVGLHLEHI